MRIDVDVAGPAKREVESAVTRHLLQHVVDEREPGRDLDPPASFESDCGLQLRFLAFPDDLSDP
jgi:hypothetical protein